MLMVALMALIMVLVEKVIGCATVDIWLCCGQKGWSCLGIIENWFHCGKKVPFF